MRGKGTGMGSRQRRATLHGMSIGVHGSKTQTPLQKLRQGVLRSLQQQQRGPATLRAHETRQGV